MNEIRRKFLSKSFKFICGLTLIEPLRLLFQDSSILKASETNDIIKDAPLARYWIDSNSYASDCMICHKKTDSLKNKFYHKEKFIKCQLCAKDCMIAEGERGKCKARINVNGKLKSLVYGRPVSMHVDPIEKKPFYHFLPGTLAFSMSTTGCPLSCKFCQNWEISQAKPEDYDVLYFSPEKIVNKTEEIKAPVVAFTYNEPTVFAEYLIDIAKKAFEKKIKCVLVSCGFMKEAPLNDMCDVLSAIKIDLKGFDKNFYKNICSAELEPVLKSIKIISKRKIHLEIVNLVVPTLNDSKYMLTELCKWVMGEIGPDVPIHFTRFHPDYQMLNLPPTPASVLEEAYQTAKKIGIRYPFVGNVPDHPGNNTYCHACGKPIILRTGFFVTKNDMKNGRCSYCNSIISGVWV